MESNGLIKRNLNRPPIKDTVDVPAGGYTVLRFLADNPGVWMFHCHIEWHVEMGMSILLKVGNKNDLPIKPKNMPNCDSFNDIYNTTTTTYISSSFIITIFVLLVVFIINK